MRRILVALALSSSLAALAQDAPPTDSGSANPAPEFHVHYISGNSVYVDGGRNLGLAEGTELVLKQSSKDAADSAQNQAIAAGIIARLSVVSVATTSAVCEVKASSRDLVVGDLLVLPDTEVEKLVEKNALGRTRTYPMVVSFSAGDPLDEEVRETVPAPPLPEVNQARGRIGFDMSSIRGIGANASVSSSYGMVVRSDITRIAGTHWNLLGYWRGSLQTGATTSQPTIQDLINRTYQISLSYVNPKSRWTAAVGRLYVPLASSLEVIDGGYFGRQYSSGLVAGVFAGTTPDPTAWNYSPNHQIAGSFVSIHGGDYAGFAHTNTVGFGMDMLSWSPQRPFVFTENNFTYKRYFSLYHSMQIDRPTANPGAPAVSTGIGQSLLTLRFQPERHVDFDLTHTYFRNVPTYDATLLGTGLLDSYLFQGISGGARVQLPYHLAGYFSVGNSNSSSDKGSSLNLMYGATMNHIWKTGLQIDARQSTFNSAFASGNYRSVTLSRDLGDRLRINLQGGRQSYNSSVASTSSPYFGNLFVETNLGSRYFIQGAFTTQRGGTQDYNQFTTTIGVRFDNRASVRSLTHANPR